MHRCFPSLLNRFYPSLMPVSKPDRFLTDLSQSKKRKDFDKHRRRRQLITRWVKWKLKYVANLLDMWRKRRNPLVSLFGPNPIRNQKQVTTPDLLQFPFLIIIPIIWCWIMNRLFEYFDSVDSNFETSE